MAHCKYCDKEIEFIQNKSSGKKIPVDLDLITPENAEDLELMVISPFGVFEKLKHSKIGGFTCHLNNCENISLYYADNIVNQVGFSHKKHKIDKRTIYNPKGKKYSTEFLYTVEKIKCLLDDNAYISKNNLINTLLKEKYIQITIDMAEKVLKHLRKEKTVQSKIITDTRKNNNSCQHLYLSYSLDILNSLYTESKLRLKLDKNDFMLFQKNSTEVSSYEKV